jgi:hypothetical protein
MDNYTVMLDGWNMDVVNTTDLTARFLPSPDLSLPMSRFQHAMAVLNSSMVIVGGSNNVSQDQNSVMRYDRYWVYDYLMGARS